MENRLILPKDSTEKGAWVFKWLVKNGITPKWLPGNSEPTTKPHSVLVFKWSGLFSAHPLRPTPKPGVKARPQSLDRNPQIRLRCRPKAVWFCCVGPVSKLTAVYFCVLWASEERRSQDTEGWLVFPEGPLVLPLISSLPEFMNFKLFGKTILVVQ